MIVFAVRYRCMVELNVILDRHAEDGSTKPVPTFDVHDHFLRPLIETPRMNK
jgi:hypothetical protein